MTVQPFGATKGVLYMTVTPSKEDRNTLKVVRPQRYQKKDLLQARHQAFRVNTNMTHMKFRGVSSISGNWVNMTYLILLGT